MKRCSCYRTFDASYKQPLVSRLERMRQDGSLISSIAACQIEETHDSRNKDPWLWLIYQLEPLEWPLKLMLERPTEWVSQLCCPMYLFGKEVSTRQVPLSKRHKLQPKPFHQRGCAVREVFVKSTESKYSK